MRRAAETGLLAEGQKLDVKREMPTNRDLAKDIAAFSLYGGVIIIGVDEKPPPAPPELHPVELDGLSERISQIAATRVDEAVIVTTTAIDSSTEPGKGYMVVEVPASPRGPHMADGKYYGRADKTNRVLPHAEVLQHHERQVRENKDILAAAREELESMKANIGFHSPPMLLRAKPLGATDGLLMASRYLTPGNRTSATWYRQRPCRRTNNSCQVFATRPGFHLDQRGQRRPRICLRASISAATETRQKSFSAKTEHSRWSLNELFTTAATRAASSSKTFISATPI